MSGPTEAATWLVPEPRAVDFFDLKGVVEEVLAHLYLRARARYEPSDHPSFQPGRAATLKIDGRTVGTLGELHPRVRQANGLPEQRVAAADLDLGTLIALVPDAVGVRPIPRFPAVMQDLAAIVPEGTAASEVERVIREVGAEQVDSVTLFDVYQGSSIPAGKKSLAFSLRYLHPERTMTDEEVAGYHARITRALRDRLGAQIRGEDG